MQAHFFMEQHHTHTHLHETVNFQHIHTYFISKFMLNFTLHLHSFFFQNACMGMVFGFQTTTTKKTIIILRICGYMNLKKIVLVKLLTHRKLFRLRNSE